MSEHDLTGLESAIDLKSNLLRALSAGRPHEWPHHVDTFIARLAGSSLQDATALAVLLADLRAEMHALANTPGRSSNAAAAVAEEHSLMAMSGDEVLAWFRNEVVAIARQVPPGGDGRSPLVDDAVRFIDQHYAEPVTTGTLASALGQSKRQLVTLFQRQMGQTIHEYVTRVRLRRGMELITEGEKIEAVSLMVGYKSKKNFYRHFKAAVGMTPLTYKSSVIERTSVRNLREEPP
jgi:AraC-like DNA-binding protein